MNWRSWRGCTCCRFVYLFLKVNQCSISLQGVVAYHLGRDREARLQLEKVSTELQLLAVDEMDLVEIVSMGYSMAEASTGLRAALGGRKLAVEHIMRRHDEKAEIVHMSDLHISIYMFFISCLKRIAMFYYFQNSPYS